MVGALVGDSKRHGFELLHVILDPQHPDERLESEGAATMRTRARTTGVSTDQTRLAEDLSAFVADARCDGICEADDAPELLGCLGRFGDYGRLRTTQKVNV